MWRCASPRSLSFVVISCKIGSSSCCLYLSLLKRLYVTTVQVFVTFHIPDSSDTPITNLQIVLFHQVRDLSVVTVSRAFHLKDLFFESSLRRGVWGHVPLAPPILSSSCCVHLPIPSGGRTRTTAVKQKAHEMKADRIQGHLEKKRRMTYLTEESKNSAATAVKVPT